MILYLIIINKQNFTTKESICRIKFSIFAEIKNTEYEFYGNKYH